VERRQEREGDGCGEDAVFFHDAADLRKPSEKSMQRSQGGGIFEKKVTGILPPQRSPSLCVF
jgi:hypothetical protein